MGRCLLAEYDSKVIVLLVVVDYKITSGVSFADQLGATHLGVGRRNLKVFNTTKLAHEYKCICH